MTLNSSDRIHAARLKRELESIKSRVASHRSGYRFLKSSGAMDAQLQTTAAVIERALFDRMNVVENQLDSLC